MRVCELNLQWSKYIVNATLSFVGEEYFNDVRGSQLVILCSFNSLHNSDIKENVVTISTMESCY